MNESAAENHTSDLALKNAAIGSLILAIVKAVGFGFSGSLLVLASLLDSIADSLTSFINFKISKLARHDPDKEHPFGHGGFEVAASLTQGIIIVFFGVNLFIEAGRRLIYADHLGIEVNEIGIAIAVLLFSAVGGLLIQKVLSSQIKLTNKAMERSLALEADHAHYLGDVFSNILAALGLTFVYFTDIPAYDAVFALLAAAFLVKTAYPILKKCYLDIIHQEADPKLQQLIVDVIMATDPSRIKGIHQLRSRESGPVLFVDFHMTLSGTISLLTAHEISDRVESEIQRVLPRADVIIHLDPDGEPDHTEWDVSYQIPNEKVSEKPTPKLSE